MSETPRRRFMNRNAALKKERSSWIEHYRDISDYVRPQRSRFLATDRNKGNRKNDKIINGTAIRASRILASGMAATITSPVRPWFRLTTSDPKLSEVGAVRDWLHVVEERIRLAFAKSNIYDKLHAGYEDLGDFGTTVIILEADDEDGLRAYGLPVGRYCLATSARGQVDTVYDELSLTVAQIVEMFGVEKCSPDVREKHKVGNLDEWVEVLHVIEPNRARVLGRGDAKGKKWRSVWMETHQDETVGFLRDSGYDENPILAPRWHVTGEDIYGRSPGMDALGDAKALQTLERRKAEVADKIVRPPMNAPMGAMHRKLSLLPGDVNYVDTMSGSQPFAPAIVVNPQAFGVIGEEIQQHERRINETFFADLWLAMAQADGKMTAREVSERVQEKMLQLGPVHERLQDELLDPMIDRAFAVLERSGWFPPAPDEIHGQELKVEYISSMAQAQKATQTVGIERVAQFAIGLAQAFPQALDKVNADELIDTYADAVGTNPAIINDDEQVERIRSARAQQQQQAQQAAMMQQSADAAKTLSETDVESESALSRLTESLGGLQ